MANVLVQLADAVVADLNATGFSVEFTAERTYLPLHTLEQLANVVVIVMPATRELESADRSTTFNDLAIEIGVQKHLANLPGAPDGTDDA